MEHCVVWMGLLAVLLFAAAGGAAAAEPWRAVEQPELKQALEHAPVLRTEVLGEPARSPLGSAGRALALVYDDVVKQAMQLAYLDGLMGLAAVAAVTAVLVWMARSPRAVAAETTR